MAISTDTKTTTTQTLSPSILDLLARLTGPGDLTTTTEKQLTGAGASFQDFLKSINRPVATELSQQILEALTTGGIGGGGLPIISARLEAAKRANARTFGETEGELARIGITGDPSGQRILANQRRESAFREGQIPANVAQEFINLAPNFVSANQALQAQLLQGTGTTTTTRPREELLAQIFPSLISNTGTRTVIEEKELDITDILTTFAALGGSDLIRNVLNSLGLGGLLGGAAQAGGQAGQAGQAGGDAISLISSIVGPLSRLGGDVFARLANVANSLGIPTSITGISGLLSSVDAGLAAGGATIPSDAGLSSLLQSVLGSSGGFDLFSGAGGGFGEGAELFDAFDLFGTGGGGFGDLFGSLFDFSSASAPAAGVGAAGAAAPTAGGTGALSNILSTLGIPLAAASFVTNPSGFFGVGTLFKALFGAGEDIPIGEIVIPNIPGVKLEQIDIDRAIEALNNTGRRVVSGKIETLNHPTLGSFPAIRVVSQIGEFGDPDTTKLVPLLQVADQFAFAAEPNVVPASSRRFVPGVIREGEEEDPATVSTLFDPSGAGNFRFRDVLFSRDILGLGGEEFSGDLPVAPRQGAQTIFQLTGDI